MHWKILDSPPCIPNISPCDSRVLDSLKKALKSRRLWSEEDVNSVMVQWFQQQHTECFAEGVHRLVSQRDACLWDYFNGL
jgi:hypothetical protein